MIEFLIIVLAILVIVGTGIYLYLDNKRQNEFLFELLKDLPCEDQLEVLKRFYK